MLENTDDEHYITMPEIMEELGKYEVTADRKTIYADLRDLSVLGIEVEGEPIGNRYHYRVVNRPFELPELKLLVDSIQSSKFITEKKTNTLIKKLDMADYAKKSFGMFRGKETSVKMLVNNSLAGVIIDRFGKDVMMIPEDEEHFRVNVDVHVSKQFLGWVFSLGEAVKIIGPDEVVEQMRGEARRLMEQYGE